MNAPTPTITIPGTFPGMNWLIKASRQPWEAYMILFHAYTGSVVAAVKNRHEPVTDYPVHLAFDWFCKDSGSDPDNIAAAKKLIIDGLVEGGILADDDWNHICGLSDRFHIDSQNPRVVVNIRSDGELRASVP